MVSLFGRKTEEYVILDSTFKISKDPEDQRYRVYLGLVSK